MELKGESGILEITILRRSNPITNDCWDGNWLESEVKINVPGFRALYGTNLRVDDLKKFCKDLNNFQTRTVNEVAFTTMEEGLYLHFILEPTGIVVCKGTASNQTGNSLEFIFQVYFTAIEAFANDLNSVLKLYPIIGNFE